MPLNTITKARMGAQTIGSFAVSVSLAKRTEVYDTGCDAEDFPSCAAKFFSWGPPPGVSSVRKRIVNGTTVRLITRLAIAIGMALGPPNKSPRMAGPKKGTAGAEAVSATSALVLIRTRKAKWENRNATP